MEKNEEKKKKNFIKNIFVKTEKQNVNIYSWGEGEPPSPQENIKYVLIGNHDVIKK